MPRSIQITSKVKVLHSPMQTKQSEPGQTGLSLPVHVSATASRYLFCIRNQVLSSLRSQPWLQSFNSKKCQCTHESHLTKALLWTAIKIPQQQGNSDTGGLVLSPDCHSCESRTHAGLGPNPHMQSVFSPQCTNIRSVTKKRKYRRKAAH